MKVHIICRNPESDRIIPRLALSLSQTLHWSIGPRPDPNADVNYFFPYLEYHNTRQLPDTPLAGWFTHHDTYQRGKENLWPDAARRMNLRTVTASPYYPDLTQYGLTCLVVPPLDTDKFKPDSRRIPADLPVVGTSGWVYPGGRKGEHLLRKLAESDLPIHLTACGQGWPVKCKEIDFEYLQTYYQTLDIYLSTSLIEGVGYGPLEALACGVPVVIPAGVGVFDDLPVAKGIYRYPPGDYSGMVDALYQAIEAGHHDKEELRSLISRFTLDNWARDHLVAFEDLLEGGSPAEVYYQDWQSKRGIYYVAFGEPARNMAVQAIRSARRFMPEIPIALVSDRPLNAGETHFIQQPDIDIGGRIAKIKIDNLAPKEWEYILYLDADTEIVADVSVLFQFLADGWELVICKNPSRFHILAEMVRPDNHDESQYTFDQIGTNQVLQLNGGVFAYRRNARTKLFFELWLEEWNRFGKRDQAALHRALWQQPLKTYVLGNEFNTVIRYDDPGITAGILHFPMQARRWTGRIAGRLDSPEAWAAVRR